MSNDEGNISDESEIGDLPPAPITLTAVPLRRYSTPYIIELSVYRHGQPYCRIIGKGGAF